ncbi:hypothetical protein Syun_009970 [Stephania yunnanensis]|uniref:Protein kinase domain-containing protein n=1 Tax=Stephania yunnanensis TaxID=152371 RepID=A0AAP0PST3_9MAGN
MTDEALGLKKEGRRGLSQVYYACNIIYSTSTFLLGNALFKKQVEGLELLQRDVSTPKELLEGVQATEQNYVLTVFDNFSASVVVDGHNDADLPLFSLASVSAATHNFSSANELGQGGFGPVYKGTLLNGQEVAVKRLSRDSGQGLEELKNEMMLIAKLQHKNLVRLLGCCIEGDEKTLQQFWFLATHTNKLFIRDSLFRLANSAMQRNKTTDTSSTTTGRDGTRTIAGDETDDRFINITFILNVAQNLDASYLNEFLKESKKVLLKDRPRFQKVAMRVKS